jgi:hypothetical protein
MQLSSGIGCVGCQTIPRARSSDHRRQISVCESLRARIRSPLCATCACGGYHRRSRRDAGHPPVRVSACHRCFEAAQNTYVAKVLHNIEEVICLLAPVSHSINGFTENQIFRDFGPHVLLLWLYLKVATAAAINLDIKLLEFSRPSTFPDPEGVSGGSSLRAHSVRTYSLRLISISMRSLRGGEGGAGGGGGGVGERALSTPATGQHDMAWYFHAAIETYRGRCACDV